MSNALIAGPVDTATPFSGAGLLDSGTQLASAIESGNWVEGGLAAFSTVVDTVATAIDPLVAHRRRPRLADRSLRAHQRLVQRPDRRRRRRRRVLPDLDQRPKPAQQLRRLPRPRRQRPRRYGRRSHRRLPPLSNRRRRPHPRLRPMGRRHGHRPADRLDHRPGRPRPRPRHPLSARGSAISWATEAVVTVGIATPWIISQVSSRVASWTAKISGKLTGLLRSCGKLGDLLNELRALMSKGAGLLGSVPRRAPHGEAPPRVPRYSEEAPARAPTSSRAKRSLLHTSPRWMQPATTRHFSAMALFTTTTFDNANLGAPNGDVWAMPVSDAARIDSVSAAAKETGMAPQAADAYMNGGDVYAVHFPSTRVTSAARA